MHAFVVLGLVFPCQAKTLAWGTSPKWPILCRVGRKTLTQSINSACCSVVVVVMCIHELYAVSHRVANYQPNEAAADHPQRGLWEAGENVEHCLSFASCVDTCQLLQGPTFCKNMGGWWRWALVSPDGVAPSRMVGVSASVNLPLHHKVQKFSSGTGSPGWSRKKGCKTVVVWWCGARPYFCVLLWQDV